MASGLLVYPFGLSSALVRSLCGDSGVYRAGDCQMGWGYMLAIVGVMLTLFLPFFAKYAPKEHLSPTPLPTILWGGLNVALVGDLWTYLGNGEIGSDVRSGPDEGGRRCARGTPCDVKLYYVERTLFFQQRNVSRQQPRCFIVSGRDLLVLNYAPDTFVSLLHGINHLNHSIKKVMTCS
ncbi:hypothetical protein AAFF_G00272620 [Aldrovandia affinis]|uniref:Uncharacterized protein n=1 Tax=Aldrovandia affinis TaxID=143900 RepID=A0AAD7RAQ4_9TELE|nr:hypothetical protein AAFF_G00272620 [Aldrovandia affinis]